MLHKVEKFKNLFVDNNSRIQSYKREETYINHSTANYVLNYIKNIIDVGTIPPNSVIYTNKLSNIPRFKLKEYCDLNNIKRTTKLQDAEYVLISKQTLKDLKIIDVLSKCSPGSPVPKITDELFLKNNGLVSGNYKFNSNFSSFTKLSKFVQQTNIPDLCKLSYSNEKFVELIEFILTLINNNWTPKFVYDESLFVELNTSTGIEFSDDVESTLRNMLISSQDKTHKDLGVEMLSNVILTPTSLFKISFILNELHNKEYSLKDYVNKNANFKSLLNVLKDNKIVWEGNWQVFGLSMWKKYQNTEFKDTVKKFMVSSLNTYLVKHYKDMDLIESIKFISER